MRLRYYVQRLAARVGRDVPTDSAQPSGSGDFSSAWTAGTRFSNQACGFCKLLEHKSRSLPATIEHDNP
ncbi:hypothetical protein Trco_002835 [Trichoderma cornu-damae]|uniref:Uncharacterized protein n=1 Tax=Trichoderma cornu-damae TaxID=654480 RepID=A0A9P8TZH8_9HYPO|nr:hypothetical protein Trco_002835 [Trichoderma cornu-damae]